MEASGNEVRGNGEDRPLWIALWVSQQCKAQSDPLHGYFCGNLCII
jgi:hypothetical protein